MEKKDDSNRIDNFLEASLREKEERERRKRELKKTASRQRYRTLAALLSGGLITLAFVLIFSGDKDEPEVPDDEPNPYFAIIQEKEYSLTSTSLLLRELFLTDEDMSELARMTNLTRLELKACRLEDISFLAELTKLERLDLRFNFITDLSPLSGLTNLTHLYLQHNDISDVSPLAKLTNLQELELGSNLLTDISPLYNRLPNLKNIYIYGSVKDSQDIPYLDEHKYGAPIKAGFPGVKIHF